MPRRRLTVVALATITVLLGATGPAAADGTSPTPGTSAGPTGDGERLCKRAARVDQRIDKALARLNGPVTERGSIARLQKRVDNAKAAGNTEVETYLSDRLTFRKSLVPTLQQRSTDIAQVTTWCNAHNDGATT